MYLVLDSTIVSLFPQKLSAQSDFSRSCLSTRNHFPLHVRLLVTRQSISSQRFGSQYSSNNRSLDGDSNSRCRRLCEVCEVKNGTHPGRLLRILQRILSCPIERNKSTHRGSDAAPSCSVLGTSHRHSHESKHDLL